MKKLPSPGHSCDNPKRENRLRPKKKFEVPRVHAPTALGGKNAKTAALSILPAQVYLIATNRTASDAPPPLGDEPLRFDTASAVEVSDGAGLGPSHEGGERPNQETAE
jgi:hypothetical protein